MINEYLVVPNMGQKGRMFLRFLSAAVLLKVGETEGFGGFEQGNAEILASEMLVARLGDDDLDFRHAVKIAQEIYTINAPGVKAFVGEFA